MMSTLWTVAAVCLCLGGHPCSETSELKKAIVRMQDLYHVNFVYDSSLEMIRLSGIFSSGKSLKENLQTVFSGTGIKWEIKGSYVFCLNRASILSQDTCVRIMGNHSLMSRCMIRICISVP